MKKRRGQILLVSVGALLVAVAARAGDQTSDAVPGKIHEQLARMAGDYTTVSKFMMKPGDPGRETQGSAKLKTILGGRFIMEETEGSLLGQKNSGFHLLGYNNGAGQYEGTWAYTGSTALMNLKGSSKDDGKTIELAATYEQIKGTVTNLTVVIRQIDDDHLVVALIAKGPDGKQGPTLETSYTRKK